MFIQIKQITRKCSPHINIFQPLKEIDPLYVCHAMHEGLHLSSQLNKPFQDIPPAEPTYLCEVQNIVIWCVYILQKGTELYCTAVSPWI